MWTKRFLTGLMLTALAGGAARGDAVQLTNGGTVRGIVVAETEEAVTVNVGHGFVTFARDQIAGIVPTDPGPLHLEAARKLLARGLLDQAELRFREAAESVECATPARDGLDAVARQRRRVEDSRIQSEMNRARTLAASGQTRKAVDALSEAIAGRGGDDRSLALLGELRCRLAYEYIDRIQYTKAAEQILLAREEGAPMADLRYLLGLLSQAQGRALPARYEIALALEEKPELAQAYPSAAAQEIPRMALVGPEAAEGGEVVSWQQSLTTPRREGGVPGLARSIAPEIREAVRRHSSRYQVPESLVIAVIEAESSFNPRAVSPAGARGLMQLMPGTARDMGVADPFNADENIRGGTKYLSLMLNRFDNNMRFALAAYNAGPETVKFHGDVPPYPETQRYVKRVLARYHELVLSSPAGS